MKPNRTGSLIYSLIIGLILCVPHTHAAKRVALVIGNSDYATAPLRNPVNDANDISKVLSDIGFEVQHPTNLNLNLNLNRTQMRRAVSEFGRSLGRAYIGLFHFAGHGMEVKDKVT